MLCRCAAFSVAPLNVRLAVVPEKLTFTVSPLVAVTTELPLVSATPEPSKLRISLAPALTLVTVSVIEVKVWPASTVEATIGVVKRSTAAPPSVKVGSTAVAVSVGWSLTGVTRTVEAIPGAAGLSFAPTFAPESTSSVMVTMRSPAVGSWLASLKASPSISVCSAAELSVAPPKVSVAVVPTTVTVTVSPLRHGNDRIAVGQGGGRAVEAEDLAGAVDDTGHRQRHRCEGLAGFHGRGRDAAEQVGCRAALGEGRVDRGGGQRRLVVDRRDMHRSRRRRALPWRRPD